MDKTIQTFIFLFLMVGCSNQTNDNGLLELQVQRLLKSVSDQVSDRYSNIDILFVVNENANRALYEKVGYVKSYNDSIIYQLRQSKNPKSILQKITGNYLEFINGLGLNRSSTSRIIRERLNYWNNLDSRKINNDLLEADIRLCELDIINDLYDNYINNGFHFNTVKPVILDTRKELSLGEIYTARIGIQAYDSTQLPIFYKDNKELPVEEGYGILRYTSNTPGIKNINGNIIVVKADYTIDTLKYEYRIEFK